MSEQPGIEYGPDQPLRIIALERTSIALPAQWEGESEHHARVYIRYRNGYLAVHLGPDIDTAIDRAPVWDWQSDDHLDGWMSLPELRETLPDWIMIYAGVAAERQEDAYAPGMPERLSRGAIETIKRLMEDGTIEVVTCEGMALEPDAFGVLRPADGALRHEAPESTEEDGE